MHESEHSYKGFKVRLVMPDGVMPDGVNSGGHFGRVQISGPDQSVGVRFTPDWTQPPKTAEEAEAWLFAYAAGVIDCELAGGLGMDLRNE